VSRQREENSQGVTRQQDQDRDGEIEDFEDFWIFENWEYCHK
jgi:hypothetical protein